MASIMHTRSQCRDDGFHHYYFRVRHFFGRAPPLLYANRRVREHAHLIHVTCTNILYCGYAHEGGNVTSERSVFSLSRDYQWLSNLQLIPLVSVVWGLSVVGGIRGMRVGCKVSF